MCRRPAAPRRAAPKQHRHAQFLGDHADRALGAEVAVGHEQAVHSCLAEVLDRPVNVALIFDQAILEYILQVHVRHAPRLEPFLQRLLLAHASSLLKTNLPIGHRPLSGFFSGIA